MEHRKKRQRNWYGLHVLGLAAVCLMLTACGPDKGEEEDTTARTESTAQTDDSSYSRESGTEPLIRVMVEAESEEQCHAYVDQVVDVIRARGHELVQ